MIGGNALSRRKHDPATYVALALQGLSNYAIAKKLGVHEKTVRVGLDEAGFNRHDRFNPSLMAGIKLDPPCDHIGEAMITADYHLPLFSAKVGNQVLDVARERGIKALVAAGDMFNMDALSRFEPKQESADLWTEIEVGIEVAATLLKTFDVIYLLKGNHDYRMTKALGFKLKFDAAMRMVFGALGEESLKKIRFTNLDHMWCRPWPDAPSELSYYVCHPQAYTQVPLSKTRILADKINANVITAHSHHFAQGFARDGKKICAEAGGLFDASKTEYLQTTTTYPNWQNGFFYLAYQGERLGIGSPPNLWTPRA